jgi:hypothetical protein
MGETPEDRSTKEGAMRRSALVLLVVPLLLASCATSKRPVIYADPALKKNLVHKGSRAVLMPADVDVKTVVADMVAAFDGNPTAGVAYVRSALNAYLTGAEEIPSIYQDGRKIRLDFGDFAATADADRINQLVTFKADDYGLVSAEIEDPEALAGLLTSAGIDYLFFLQGLALTRGTSTANPVPIALPSGGIVMAGGGAAGVVTLSGQVLIWSRETRSVVWSGYAFGENRVDFRFTKGTISGAARRFALDVSKLP